MNDDRPCTCPPMERPHPCARKFALSECKAATVMDPICYRWRHQKDEVWKYGHQPQHLVPPRGKELIGYYIVQPLYSADAIEALQAECERMREELSAAQKDAERYRKLRDLWFAFGSMVNQNTLRGAAMRAIQMAGDVETLDIAIDAAMAQEKRDE